MKKTVGYLRASSNVFSLKSQENIIASYCASHNLTCDVIYCDDRYLDRKVADISRALLIGIPPTEKLPMLPAWEQLMVDILNDEIGTIVVDCILRLYRNYETKLALERICQEHNVTIIEAGTEPFPANTGAVKIALYHCTDEAQRRPQIALQVVDSLYEYAARSHPGSVCSLFLDTSLLKYKHPNHIKLMDTIASYDIVLVHSIYRFETKMSSFFSLVRKLNASGTRIVSLSEGPVELLPDICDLQSKPLRVALYDRKTGNSPIDSHALFLERCNLFIKYRTHWAIAGVYSDKRSSPSQPALQQLIRDRPSYDLVLMDSFRKIHEHSAQFYKFKSQIKAPLVSLKEGSIL